jgi:hypothetical protein
VTPCGPLSHVSRGPRLPVPRQRGRGSHSSALLGGTAGLVCGVDYRPVVIIRLPLGVGRPLGYRNGYSRWTSRPPLLTGCLPLVRQYRRKPLIVEAAQLPPLTEDGAQARWEEIRAWCDGRLSEHAQQRQVFYHGDPGSMKTSRNERSLRV